MIPVLQVIYSAKGMNRTWKWFSMITVCIFTLRDAMRTVQAAFKITKYGTKHTVLNMSEEVQIVADAQWTLSLFSFTMLIVICVRDKEYSFAKLVQKSNTAPKLLDK